jgi:CelD/BcsL family acetyltransferase involved in cellulose biosynthesis
MAITTAWIEDPTEFAKLADEWEPLLPTDAHPFDQHCWHAAWWEAFGGSDRLAVATVRRDGRLVGAFPLRRRGRLTAGLVNGHSTSCRPLAVDAETMRELVAMVLSGSRGELDLGGLPIGDPGLAELERQIGSTRRRLLLEPALASPYIDTRGDYETWRNENKHRWKAPLERKWRKIDRDHEAVWGLVEAPADLDAELAEGLRIEASGWKGEGGTAIESSPDSALFYRLMADSFQERDELRFNWLHLDGVAVSFDFCLLYRKRLYTLKSGFDEDYKSLAPGLVHRLAVIKRCFEMDIDEHDLLGNEVGWKTRFASGNRPHVNLRAYGAGPVGIARHAYRSHLRPALKSAYHGLRRSDS